MVLDTGIRARKGDSAGLPWGFLAAAGVLAVILVFGIWVLTAEPTVEQVVTDMPLEQLQ